MAVPLNTVAKDVIISIILGIFAVLKFTLGDKSTHDLVKFLDVIRVFIKIKIHTQN